MRLPKESELSKEQKEVIFAPIEGTTLVVGPPGSGKTVVAIHRERAMKKKGVPVQSLVYNNVLSRYTGTKATFYSWVQEWWRSATNSSFPFAFAYGKDGKSKRRMDFVSAESAARNIHKTTLRQKGNWGHLVLDEAQDFAPEAHRFLSSVPNIVFAGFPEEQRPSMCILADENQRLTESNATIDQIRKSHLLTNDSEYALTRNYRNSAEIAKVAAHFFVGLPSGKPAPPERRSDKPRLSLTTSIDDAVQRITSYAKAHRNQEIGVLVYFDNIRRQMFNKLKHRLDAEMVVQTYTSYDKEAKKNAERLVFDKPGALTVLCFASSKGLEFDAVFLPELQCMPIDAANRDQARMNLYVMCSRARDQLWMMVSDPGRLSPIWELLPRNGDLTEEVR